MIVGTTSSAAHEHVNVTRSPMRAARRAGMTPAPIATVARPAAVAARIAGSPLLTCKTSESATLPSLVEALRRLLWAMMKDQKLVTGECQLCVSFALVVGEFDFVCAVQELHNCADLAEQEAVLGHV